MSWLGFIKYPEKSVAIPKQTTAWLGFFIFSTNTTCNRVTIRKSAELIDNLVTSFLQ